METLRLRSFSRLLTFEAERLLKAFGAVTRIDNPEGLPLPMVTRKIKLAVSRLRLCWSRIAKAHQMRTAPNHLDKPDRIEYLLAERGIISVQVLNEFAAVALRELRRPLWI